MSREQTEWREMSDAEHTSDVVSLEAKLEAALTELKVLKQFVPGLDTTNGDMKYAYFIYAVSETGEGTVHFQGIATSDLKIDTPEKFERFLRIFKKQKKLSDSNLVIKSFSFLHHVFV